MASLAGPIAPGTRRPEVAPATEGRKLVRDSVIVTLGGQLERALGTFTSLALRWGLDPARLGVYGGLKLFLDNTNRSSLGIGLGAVQEIPILRASGRFAEARHLANVAYTTNTLTCLVYAALLVLFAWLRVPALAGDALAAEWTWGLVAVAGLALIKRYESFLVAILRAHQEFALTAELDVVESLASGIAVAAGLWLAGFWGLLAAVALVLLVKIAYAHARHPLRFSWALDLPLTWRMMVLGLPILANTAVFAALLSLDRVLILWRVPNGEHAAGLYSIAIMGTSWSLDLAGRLVLVAYTAFQTTLGRTNDPKAVARQAARAIEAQAPVLLAGSAVAYVVAPTFLGLLMPRYVDGLVALRPLLPGMVLLGLAWPARQMLIALGRPYTLCLATTLGLVLTSLAGIIGADRSGIEGVAWGMTIGSAAVHALTSAAAFVPALGLSAWLGHQSRLLGTIAVFTSGTLLSAHIPLGLSRPELDFCVRVGLLAVFLPPILWRWGWRHHWGGILMRRS